MSEAIRIYLPWLMSAVTIYMTLMAGNKAPWAWAVGLGNQVFWLTWIIATEAWGLLPITAALTFVYARNHLKWMKPEASAATRYVDPSPFHPDVLRVHAEFGGDLVDMQRRYDAASTR